jgi:protein gp37
MAKRLRGRCGYPADEPFKVTLHPDRLEQPLRWRKPRKVFVCSMGDLFHEDVPFEFTRRIFGIMHSANRHTFQVLTKRPKRLRKFIEYYSEWIGFNAWPKEYQHVWLGASASTQEDLERVMPDLLATPAAMRFLSLEPLLGPIDLEHVKGIAKWPVDVLRGGTWDLSRGTALEGFTQHSDMNPISWVIVGGESGHGARPMHPQWVRSIRDQCKEAGVPFMFKQFGEWAPGHEAMVLAEKFGRKMREWSDGCIVSKLGKKAAGRELDGQIHDEFPKGIGYGAGELTHE